MVVFRQNKSILQGVQWTGKNLPVMEDFLGDDLEVAEGKLVLPDQPYLMFAGDWLIKLPDGSFAGMPDKVVKALFEIPADESIPWTETAESSNIAGYGYDGFAQILKVKFRSGGTYQYFDVDTTTAKEFGSAESKGRYFYLQIKERHRFEKVGP